MVEFVLKYIALGKILGFNVKIKLTTARISDEQEQCKKNIRCLATNSFILSTAYRESQYDYARDILNTFVETLKAQMPEESFALSYDDDIHFLGHLEDTKTVWGQSKAFFLLEKLINDPLLHIVHVDDSLEEKEFFALLLAYKEKAKTLENLIIEISKYDHGDPAALTRITTTLRTTNPKVIFNAIDRLDFIQAHPRGVLSTNPSNAYQKVIAAWLGGFKQPRPASPMPPLSPVLPLSGGSRHAFFGAGGDNETTSKIPFDTVQSNQHGM